MGSCCSSTPKDTNTDISIKHEKQKIPKAVRQAVWAKYHDDKTTGVCYACGKEIQNKGWHCSHVVSENKGGKIEIDNLRTCCQHCNLSMGNQNLYAYVRDKKLTGPAQTHVNQYFKKHESQKFDKRTNNWGR
jgi:5-methylcytosine-specific restriction endonuclease McrA